MTTLPIISFDEEKIGETYLNLKTAPEDTARSIDHRAIVTDLQNKQRGNGVDAASGRNSRRRNQAYAQKKTVKRQRNLKNEFCLFSDMSYVTEKLRTTKKKEGTF